MPNADRNIEGLIVRALDGALSEDEELELNRELIRDPAARRLMEEYRRIDELAGSALRESLRGAGLPLNPETLPPRVTAEPRARYHRGWWLVPGAVAAALLGLVVARLPIAPLSNQRVADQPYGGAGLADGTIPRVGGGDSASQQGLMHTVGEGPIGGKIERNTGRDVIGVIGEDGNIYWLEIDRVQTIRRPRQEANRSTAIGEM